MFSFDSFKGIFSCSCNRVSVAKSETADCCDEEILSLRVALSLGSTSSVYCCCSFISCSTISKSKESFVGNLLAPAAALCMLAHAQMTYQQYEIFLARGGEPIPLKSPPAAPVATLDHEATATDESK